MSRRLQATLLAAAVALSPIPLIATTAPSAAQVNVNVNVGFDYFHDGLSSYGDWNHHPRWGDVWRPSRVGADFRPYFRGYWVNTEYGMTFNSEEPWGDLTYHYGRWVYDPYDRWLWVPGYTWAPAWVVWRGDARNIGWFPMPPDDRFLSGVEVYRDDWDWNRGYFGYSDWYGPSIATGLLAAWTFVALDRFADRDYYRYVQPRTQIVNIVNNTTNITNYVTVNNRIVNRSVDVAQVERASGRRIERVEARQVVRSPITTVDAGRQVVMRERERHGGDVRAAARERVQRLPAQEAKLPVQERRSIRQRDQQQAQQPQGQQAPDADRGGRVDRNQQREQQKAEPRGRIERDKQGAIEQPQPDRGAAVQQQREEQQRARIEQDRGRADQQNRAAAERQQRDQAEQQNRARADQQRADQPQRAEQPNRVREEQGARAQQAERQQQAQAEQQNRARAQQAERQQQQQAAAEERQQAAKAKQQKEEEEKDRKARN